MIVYINELKPTTPEHLRICANVLSPLTLNKMERNITHYPKDAPRSQKCLKSTFSRTILEVFRTDRSFHVL